MFFAQTVSFVPHHGWSPFANPVLELFRFKSMTQHLIKCAGEILVSGEEKHQKARPGMAHRRGCLSTSSSTGDAGPTMTHKNDRDRNGILDHRVSHARLFRLA